MCALKKVVFFCFNFIRQKLLAWPFLLIKLKSQREPVDLFSWYLFQAKGRWFVLSTLRMCSVDVFVRNGNLVRFSFTVQGAAARVTARLWYVWFWRVERTQSGRYWSVSRIPHRCPWWCVTAPGGRPTCSHSLTNTLRMTGKPSLNLAEVFFVFFSRFHFRILLIKLVRLSGWDGKKQINWCFVFLELISPGLMISYWWARDHLKPEWHFSNVFKWSLKRSARKRFVLTLFLPMTTREVSMAHLELRLMIQNYFPFN